MDAPQEPSYMRKGAYLLPDVRDAVNRRRDHAPDPARLAAETGYPEHEVLAVLEALVLEDLGVCA